MNEDPYETPMMIYPAIHYTMGGIWVDYELMTSIPGLFAIGEANFSDHGANRLGASALMQGLAADILFFPTLCKITLPIRFRYRDSIPIARNSMKQKKVLRSVFQNLCTLMANIRLIFP